MAVFGVADGQIGEVVGVGEDDVVGGLALGDEPGAEVLEGVVAEVEAVGAHHHDVGGLPEIPAVGGLHVVFEVEAELADFVGWEVGEGVAEGGELAVLGRGGWGGAAEGVRRRERGEGWGREEWMRGQKGGMVGRYEWTNGSERGRVATPSRDHARGASRRSPAPASNATQRTSFPNTI